MEITKVVKPFIRRGWPNTFGYIVYVYIYICNIEHYNQSLVSIELMNATAVNAAVEVI